MLLARFDIGGKLVEIESEGNGFINDTFVATFLMDDGAQEKVVLQRINHKVFTRPQDVMNNLRYIVEHCHRKINRDFARYARAGRFWQLTHIIRTNEGADFHIDDHGNTWRCLTFIDGARAYNQVQSLKHAEECGLAIGHFLSLVSDMHTDRLAYTIPGFHVTSNYLKLYDAAPKERAPKKLVEFVEARRKMAVELEAAEARGELKRRVIHGDPRINNILIADDTGKGTAMIDLDTCSAGLIHMDVGDAVRSICNPTGEDYNKIEDIVFKTDIFEAFMGGFLAEARRFLTPEDRKYLYHGIRLLPFELGLRFFTDYLNGNKYFKVSNPEQNLKRAIGQFHLCEIIEGMEGEIRAVIKGL